MLPSNTPNILRSTYSTMSNTRITTMAIAAAVPPLVPSPEEPLTTGSMVVVVAAVTVTDGFVVPPVVPPVVGGGESVPGVRVFEALVVLAAVVLMIAGA